MVARETVEQRHYFTSCRRVDNLIYSWHGEIVFWVGFIETNKIYAHSLFSIFLQYHYDIGEPSGVINWLDELCL
jgi:hypothetical protein